MRDQAGFFDVDERLKELTAKGDALERLNAIVNFERLCHGNLARDMWKRAGHGRDHAAVAACQSAWASALNVRSVRREIR